VTSFAQDMGVDYRRADVFVAKKSSKVGSNESETQHKSFITFNNCWASHLNPTELFLPLLVIQPGGYADVFYVHVLRCIKAFYTYDIAAIIVINNNIFRLLTFNELLGFVPQPNLPNFM